MKPEDKDKLNKCLEILDTTDLGSSLVWLWTWSTINEILENETFKANVTKDQMWDYLCEAVEADMGFSLEYGAKQHHDDVQKWMINQNYIVSTMFEDEDVELKQKRYVIPFPEQDSRKFSVTLEEVGTEKAKIGREVRSLVQGLGLNEAVELIKSAPVKILEGVSKDEAELAKSSLEAFGARVLITAN